MESSVKEGYMFMQNHSIWKPSTLKAKYFILTNECLYCFKRRGDLTSIPYDVVCLDDVALSVNEERRGLRKRYRIKLTSNEKKTYDLFCFTSEERDAWFTSIMQILASKYTDEITSSCPSTLKRQSKLLQQKRISVSCLQLTDLNVVEDPCSKTRTITPIREQLDSPAPIGHRKKYSSSSLDIAIRTDISRQTTCKGNKPSRLTFFQSEKRKSKFRAVSLMNLDQSSTDCSNFNSLGNEKLIAKRKKLAFSSLSTRLR